MSKPAAKKTPPASAEPTHRWYRIVRDSQYEYRLLSIELPESVTADATQVGKSDLARNVTDRLADRAFNSSRGRTK